MYSGVSDNSCGIPEWKKMLILKKRADEHSRRAQDGLNNKLSRSVKGSESEIHKTVTIGNINVELRSVQSASLAEGSDSENCEDLRYGPGIVDRLRAKFLNIGVKQQRKPVVRRFSSLENLPGSQSGPYRVNARGFRQKSGFSNVKKAQSMEALTCMTSEHHNFSSNRRGGVKARILSRTAVFTDENDKPRRSEYGRSVSTSNINEDELPKPDTVKHVKKLFESPSPSVSEKTAVQRFRKSTTTPPSPPPTGCGTGGCSAWTEVKKTSAGDVLCAKEYSEEEKLDHFESADNLIRDNDLSASCESEELHQRISDPPDEKQSDVGGVTYELLPLEQCQKHSTLLSQGLQKPIGAELDPASQRTTGFQEESMVVASAAASGAASTWQKPPPSTTSVVFDFRGRKDVEPHISLKPAPFGCRPAKVYGPRRSGSPPVNGVDSGKQLVAEDDPQDDEEEWNEMDIGADLPAVSGIVFDGENVKIGRGSLLEQRNKKLNIQFDDKATSIFEYPSENTSPSPNDEKECRDDSFKSTIAMESVANSRLSNYTPQVLSSNKEFELGVSQSNHRPNILSLDKSEKKEVPIMDVIIPANPSDTVGWSATETTDILF